MTERLVVQNPVQGRRHKRSEGDLGGMASRNRSGRGSGARCNGQGAGSEDRGPAGPPDRVLGMGQAAALEGRELLLVVRVHRVPPGFQALSWVLQMDWQRRPLPFNLSVVEPRSLMAMGRPGRD